MSNTEWKSMTRDASLKSLSHIPEGSWETKNIIETGDRKPIKRLGRKLSKRKVNVTELEAPVLAEYKKIGHPEKVEVVARRLSIDNESCGKRARGLTLKGFLSKVSRGIYSKI